MKTPTFAAQTRIATPLGALTLAATARGLALAWFDQQAHRSETVDAPPAPDHPVLLQAAREFAEYFAGERRVFGVPLDPQGTAFQQRVWQQLLALPFGVLGTYGRIASRLGMPTASRAVGAAVGRNPIGIIVPCHRVVGGNGALTGYAGGLPRKESLLRLEGVSRLAPSPRSLAMPEGPSADGPAEPVPWREAWSNPPPSGRHGHGRST